MCDGVICLSTEHILEPPCSYHGGCKNT